MTLQDVEKARIKYRNKIIKYILIVACVEIGMLLFVMLCAKAAGYENLFETAPALSIFMVIGTTIIIGSVMVTFIKNQGREYKTAYKSYFVEQIATKSFTNLHYDHEIGLDKSLLDSTQMVNTGDKYTSNDLITGKYKNVSFTQADVIIEKEIELEKSSSFYKIFKGQFMIFEFPKMFNYGLEVVSNSFKAYVIPKHNPHTRRKYEEIVVESPSFTKKFKVYAEDGFEAFYLLDPTLIEKIEKLNSNHRKGMLLCFVGNKLYIGINNGKDAFEPPQPFKKIDEKVEISKIQQHIKLITDYIDSLS